MKFDRSYTSPRSSEKTRKRDGKLRRKLNFKERKLTNGHLSSLDEIRVGGHLNGSIQIQKLQFSSNSSD